MRTRLSSAILFLTLILLSNGAFSQQNDPLKQAEKLHREYRFEEAMALYDKILSNTTDSLLIPKLGEKIIQCENGINLLKYAVVPNVLIKKDFPVENFYLHISGLNDKSWLQIPNPLVAGNAHKYYNAVYFPEGAKTIYYSAPDNSGSWNIYQTTQLSDTLWSEPKILGENITSQGDELFPMPSADGKELFFASNGHYGMGGFDLYVSKWNEDAQDWDVPENLGFPYSSTADDIFFLNSPDGKYTILASNRDNSKQDEIAVYVFEYIPTAIKRELSDVKEIQAISKLNVKTLEKDSEENEQKLNTPTQEGISEYAKLVAKMRLLSKEMDKNISQQEENRLLYARVTNEDDRDFIKHAITRLEEDALKIKSRLDSARYEVQKVELEFLAKGIIPIPEPAEEDKKIQRKRSLIHLYTALQTISSGTW
ncbi:MAG: PD40 domain-containing protein [Bacteroidales bacterium]|nr:PD40 domain-containing protein [Bacteroidales bacterium]